MQHVWWVPGAVDTTRSILNIPHTQYKKQTTFPTKFVVGIK